MTIGIIHSSKAMTTGIIHSSKAMTTMQAKMDAFDKELSSITGLEALKSQLQSWAKQLMLDERRRALGLKVGDRKPPHMAFLGNPGTGKTMVARLLGKLLHMLDIIPTEKVVEVQRTDLVGEYIGQTGPRTRAKIQQAEGGILFVDEAYRLMPDNRHHHDLGKEALEEIMSFMDGGKVVVIFAGYSEQMERVISANEGFRRRVTKFFYFDDFTCTELANILRLKMSNNKNDQKSPLCGLKLHPSCTVSIIAEIIREGSTEKQRSEMNGGLVDVMLVNARENLDKRMDVECGDIDALTAITLEDLRAGLGMIKQFEHKTIIGGSPATASSKDPSAVNPDEVFLNFARMNKSAFGTGSYEKTIVSSRMSDVSSTASPSHENPRVVKLQTEVTDYQVQLSLLQNMVQQIRILNKHGQPPTPLFKPQHP